MQIGDPGGGGTRRIVQDREFAKLGMISGKLSLKLLAIGFQLLDLFVLAGLDLGDDQILYFRVGSDRPDLIQDGLLDFRGWKIRGRAGISATFDRLGAGVIPVDFLLLASERVDHGMVARGASQNAFEDRPMFVDKLIPSATAIRFELLLDRVEHRSIDDGFMLSLVEHIFVANQAGVQGIGQQSINRAFVEGFSTTQEATFRLPLFAQPTAFVDILDDWEQCPEFLVE